MMTTMKKILNALKGNGCQARMLTAAMTVLSAMAGLTSCANEDTALDNTTARTAEGRTVQFTATLAPKGEGDNGGQTRAITVNDQNTANETLNVAWQKDEKIAVYYEKTNGEHATATAKVTAVDKGAATIETLSSTPLDDPKDGSEVTFIYPYSLAKDGEINKSKLQNSQQGLLTGDNSISTNFDAAKGIATLSVAAAKAVTADRIKMKNQCCICKFDISFGLQQESSDATHYNISIVFDGGENYHLSSVPKDRLSALYVAMLPESLAKCTITITELKSSDGGQTATTLKTYEKIINSVTLAADHFYRDVPVTMNQPALTATTGNITISTSTEELLLGNGAVLDGTGGTGTRLMIAAGATVTLKGVTNTGISNTYETSFPGIECLGNATIILEGENSVKGVYGKAGIYVPEGKTLTIRGGGMLTATANDGAGIGGNSGASCGNIVIEGGTINATGANRSAGIGSGEKGSCGTITITGGTITATGSAYAAGIGNGLALIAASTCGDISISGSAQVTATGGNYAAGIGSGYANNAKNTCGNISISGSAQVTAQGGTFAAGIGSGWNGKFTSISITSGITRVTATSGGQYYAPIGKGESDQGSGDVTIDDVTIDGGYDYSPDKPYTPSATTNLNWTLSGNTWTLTPKN